MIVFYRDPQRLSYPYSNNDLCQVSLWHEFVFLYLTIAVREVPSCRLSSIPPSLRPLSGQREISPNPAGYCSSLGACAATLWSNANAKVIRNQSQIMHQQRCPCRISTATLIHRRKIIAAIAATNIAAFGNEGVVTRLETVIMDEKKCGNCAKANPIPANDRMSEVGAFTHCANQPAWCYKSKFCPACNGWTKITIK